jgi:hypothetical protein
VAEQSQPLNFDDLTLIEEPVTIAGEPYVVREANGDAVLKYKGMILANLEFLDGKPTKIKAGFSAGDSLLVSLCLFKSLPNGKFQTVPIQTIQSWPNRVVKTIAKRIKKISDLKDSDDTDDAPKKEPEGTETGSD